MPRKQDAPIIPCRLEPEMVQRVESYCKDLLHRAPAIGSHGMAEEEFWESGLFHSAIERLRGIRAAATRGKKRFIHDVLEILKRRGRILGWKSAESSDRHDFEIRVDSDYVCVIEAKGCLDGNNTNIFERPPNADEFIIWSLCQNPAADPRKNVWSGIHTRLGAEIIHRRQVVDGVVVWDNLCGAARPCPKTAASGLRATKVGSRLAPPPCIYLFPRTVPDPRNNPKPPARKLDDLKFLSRLHACFHGDENDITNVDLEARMDGATVARKTSLFRGGVEIFSSGYSPVKRAR